MTHFSDKMDENCQAQKKKKKMREWDPFHLDLRNHKIRKWYHIFKMILEKKKRLTTSLEFRF